MSREGVESKRAHEMKHQFGLMLLSLMSLKWSPVKAEINYWRDSNVSYIGKEEADASDVPYFAGVWCRYHSSWQLKPWCGGVFIDKHWLITAAHCLDVGPAIKENIQIRLPTGKKINITDVITHQNYGFTTDIALVKVADPGSEFSINLPKPGWDEAFVDTGENVTIYNLLDDNLKVDGTSRPMGDIKRQKSQLPLENESCYSGEFYPFDFERQLCSSLNLTHGLKYCPGDSGSAAVAKSNATGEDFLVGIMCHITYECLDKQILRIDNTVLMNVFIRIETFMPWIIEQLKKHGTKLQVADAWKGRRYSPP